MKYGGIIIGGGASGLMLAAQKKVNRGIILEGRSTLGSKLLLTGGGHCNLTHGGSIKDFVNCYGENGAKIRKLLYKHNNIEMIDFFNSHGLETVCEDECYYPASMKASDVLDLLVKEAKANGWEFKMNAKVSDIKQNPGEKSWLVKADTTYLGEKVVIACGGVTYKNTGSDGSIFPIVEGLGIEVVKPRSALASVDIKDYPYSDLAGISLSGVKVTAYSASAGATCNGKAARETGDILFTHTGFSGPAVLNISRYCEAGESISISYNCEFCDLPKRLQKVLENRARGESGDIKTTKLDELLRSDSFIVSQVDSNGIVTAGGIALSEIDLSSMEIKKCPRLYAMGEVVDIDGKTGGYNLQFCYSSAMMIESFFLFKR